MNLQNNPELADMVIWRYMDLARYVMLLERGLFFPFVNSFQDPWEASYGGIDLKKFHKANNQLSAIEIQQLWDARLLAKRNNLSKFGASCWHISDVESTALWEIYQPKGLGIAVKSTVGRLHKSIKDSQRHIETLKIDYSNYDAIETTDDPYKLLSVKRHEFSHEKEIRFVIEFRPDELDAIEVYKWASWESGRGHREVSIREYPDGQLFAEHRGGTSTSDTTLFQRVTGSGVHLQIELKSLLQQVVLCPDASPPTRLAVKSITNSFGLNDILSFSNIDEVSYDRAEFKDLTGIMMKKKTDDMGK